MYQNQETPKKENLPVLPPAPVTRTVLVFKSAMAKTENLLNFLFFFGNETSDDEVVARSEDNSGCL